MASMTMIIPLKVHQFLHPKDMTFRNLRSHVLNSGNTTSISFCETKQDLFPRSLFPHGGGLRCLSQPISAVSSGLEASITDPKDNAITLKNAKIVVESRDDDKIQVRVDLTGEETQNIFDEVLTNLARTAPPVPGFRRQKGGKTSKVPKSFLVQILGEERVTNFVIQEIVSSTMADFENLTVKDKKFNTTQPEAELKLVFAPGKEFGFNATLELEKSEAETTSSTSSEI
ncbi:hypothetical protein HHK36_013285 [Tetracentron sinense]|uniref:peptidylprolyl isomerase n=1 Tax=Tetracentron sinense TaxID=13715 RepID=A0A835DGF6_TETSI|nr:hypothetical protein HHK36_013285 [Tetracentron sinense]